MYNLHLTAEQLEIRDTVREFVAQEIKPAAITPSRLEPLAKPLLMDALDQAARIGLRTLSLSEDAGGAGADTLTRCIAIEELAAGDPDVAAVLAETSTLADVLFNRAMNEVQRGRFLPPFLADERFHLALADREPDADTTLGIHYYRAETTAAPVRTTAARAGDGWNINGRKVAVSNAPLAKLFAVRATTEDGSIRTFLVPRESAGLSVTDDGALHRNYHGSRGSVTFSDCRIPAGHVLEPDILGPATDAAERGAPLELAINLGIGRAAYDAALDYAQLRVQGGRRIVEHQAIGTKLAEIAVRLEVARQTIWQAAWAADHPDAVADRSLPDLPLASVAKVFASEAIYRATKDAAECFGAMGVMRDMPLQKYVQDARICLHAGIGNGDLKLRLAERMAGFRRDAGAIMAAE